MTQCPILSMQHPSPGIRCGHTLDCRMTDEATGFLRLMACVLLQKVDCPVQQFFSELGDNSTQTHWMPRIRTDSEGNKCPRTRSLNESERPGYYSSGPVWIKRRCILESLFPDPFRNRQAISARAVPCQVESHGINLSHVLLCLCRVPCFIRSHE